MDYSRLLDIADGESLNSTFTYKMGAVIVVRQNIIGKGYSRVSSNIPNRLWRTHPRSSKWNTMHAETSALRDALYDGKNPRGADVIVSGFTQGGHRPVSCRPCRNCLRVLQEHGLRRAIWRIADGTWETAKLADLDVDKMVCTSCDQSISSWSTNNNGPDFQHR